MNNYLRRISLVLAIFFVVSANLFSQCTSASNGQWPFTTITPICLGTPETVTASAYTDEYSVVSLTAGTSYTFASSVGTDYLTIATEPANVAQVWGTGPLVFVCPASGLYRIYRHDDATCVGQTILRTITVTCGAPPVGCVNTFEYPAPFAAPTNNIPYSIDLCQYAGDYNTVTGVTAGNSYTSTGGGLGTYITVRSGSVAGPIVAQGFEPLNWTATVSATHYIHYNTDASCGEAFVCFESILTCTSCPPPVFLANDNCSDVTPTTIVNGAPPTTFTGNTIGANDGPGELSDLGAIAVWEAVTLTGVCNNLTVDFCGTGPGIMDPAFIVYTDCPVFGFTTADNYDFTTCGDGNLTITYINLPAGTYYLPVLADPSYITQGPYTMNVSSIDCPPPPVNDDCIGAIPMNCGDVETGNTLYATPDLTAPDCSGGVGAGNGVWYSFVGNGLPFTISLCGSGYDTYLSLYSGPDCSLLTCEANNDDAPGFICGVQSEIQDFVTTPGTTYYVLINGYFGDNGNYTLTLSAAPPANDDCINAIAIVPGVTSGDTRCTNIDAEAAVGTATAPTAGGVWYSYTPGCSGDITASLCAGTAFNSQVSVYSGTCGSLVGVAGNDDFCGSQAQTTWNGSAGTTYYILIHGNGAEEGVFDLNLTQVDNIDPVPDLPSLPSINSGCEVTLVAPTATDNCLGLVVGTTPIMTFSSNGVYTVIWTYDDGNGNIVTQNQIITILDVTPPTIGGPNDTIVGNSPGICGALVNYITPACSNPITYVNQTDDFVNDNGWLNEASLPQFIADDFIVPASDTWTIENFSAAVWEQPVGSMANITVNIHADAGGAPGAIISTQVLTSADWVAGPYLGTAFGWDITSYNFTLPTPVSGLIGGVGGTTYWLSFYENSTFFQLAWESTNVITGNSSQVAGSETGPWNPLFSDLVFSLGGTPPGTVSDDCPTCATVTQTAGLPTGSVFPTGTTTNTFVATDNAGNTASYSFDITVNDTEAPTPDNDSTAAYTFTTGATAIPILDNATATSTLVVSGVPTILNSGDITSVCLDITHTWDSDMDITLISPLGTIYGLSLSNGGSGNNYSGTCFDMTAVTPITGGTPPFNGSYIPEGAGGFDTFNGEDPNGTWTLSVTDNFAGDIGTINNFTINFNFVYPTLLPTAFVECSAVAPTATDNCDGAITATTLDPTSFTSDGTYTINWIYTDLAGNTSTQTQAIVADDITAPVADAANIDVTAECTITLTAPTATDNCAGTIIGTTSDPLTYSTVGTYTITWTYDDGNGNLSTQTQTVVVDDITAPVADLAVLPDVDGECAVAITVTPPTATDNCAGAIIGTTLDSTVFTAAGVYSITWTYDDGNGNTTIQTQTVNIGDFTAPVTPVLSNVTGSCSVTPTAPTTTDACAGTVTGTTTTVFPITTQGTTIVTWTFDDGSGNTTTANQNVIIADDTAPFGDIPFLPTLSGCSVAITVIPTATDNCAGPVTGTTTDPLNYTTPGTYTVTWSYEDANGNVSSQTQTVNVIDCSGIEDESGEWNILVYPNPGNGIFTISLAEMPTEKTEIRLVNALGQVIYNGVLKAQVQQFDFTRLASATYYLMITSSQGIITKPVIIKHND